jgi:hypothetical protein
MKLTTQVSAEHGAGGPALVSIYPTPSRALSFQVPSGAQAPNPAPQAAPSAPAICDSFVGQGGPSFITGWCRAQAAVGGAPAAPDAVAKRAIAQAQLMAQKSPVQAQQLLLKVGDDLREAGDLAAAGKVYGELTNNYSGGPNVNLISSQAPADGSAEYVAGNQIKFDPSYFEFNVTRPELGGIRQGQVDETLAMEKRLGRPVDPTNMNDAHDYFQALASDPAESKKAVAAEYQTYLDSFFVHSGDSVLWNSDIDGDLHDHVDDMLSGTVSDDAGRKVINCAGFAAITQAVFQSKPGDAAPDRFVVRLDASSDHIVAGVFDTADGSGFGVSNQDTFNFDDQTFDGTTQQMDTALDPVLNSVNPGNHMTGHGGWSQSEAEGHE